ncbi:MAG TPA: DUF4870 domain-containing protein [Lacisediminihabitans sp.]|uniref:DUF4870 domain-containing protein n=1 Tax=Lacisediminihabitans sp. TaxID=2787631 RepID=UPI002EDA874C
MSETTPPSDAASPAARPLGPGDEKVLAMLIHLGGIVFYFLPALIGYLLLRDRGPFIRQQTTAALNFQLTVLAGYAAGIFTLWLIIGVFILPVVAVINVVFSIIAAVAADRGESYVYPLAIRFVA